MGPVPERLQAGAVVMAFDAAQVEAETRAWVDRVVIGLNLCPFAKAVQVKNQIRYVVSEARTPQALLATLGEEMDRLVAADAGEVDTTLIIHPLVLEDFLEFNGFIDVADELLEEMGHAGILQVASFHPQYQFADTAPDDPGNATNRSPYPILHLLREDSVDRAVAAFPEAEVIYEKNILTMQALGAEGFAALQRQCKADAGT
jgi:uncharacterized protein